MTLPIDEKTISAHIGRPIHSPILIDSVGRFSGIDEALFLEYYRSIFANLSWDYYDVKRQQYDFLTNAFPTDEEALYPLFVEYYQGKVDFDIFRAWANRFSDTQRRAFEKITPWRRRSIAHFELYTQKGTIAIQRQSVPQFSQQLNNTDIRSLPRIFEEAPTKHIENLHFEALLRGVYRLVEQLHPKMNGITITAHFMSVRADIERPGDNSPEGAHEDGADYIISALVINRYNLKGGESQIIEQLPSGKKEIILRHTLQAGEFIFQADSKDELIYGTDLWHHVTPFYIADTNQHEGWRDIIGFDINVK